MRSAILFLVQILVVLLILCMATMEPGAGPGVLSLSKNLAPQGMKCMNLADYVFYTRDGNRIPRPPKGWPPRMRPKHYAA